MLATRVPILGIAIAVGLLVVETLGAIAYRDHREQPTSEKARTSTLLRAYVEQAIARGDDPSDRSSHPCGQLVGGAPEVDQIAYRECTRRRLERLRRGYREIDARLREIQELRRRAAELGRTRCGNAD